MIEIGRALVHDEERGGSKLEQTPCEREKLSLALTYIMSAAKDLKLNTPRRTKISPSNSDSLIKTAYYHPFFDHLILVNFVRAEPDGRSECLGLQMLQGVYRLIVDSGRLGFDIDM